MVEVLRDGDASRWGGGTDAHETRYTGLWEALAGEAGTLQSSPARRFGVFGAHHQADHLKISWDGQDWYTFSDDGRREWVPDEAGYVPDWVPALPITPGPQGV